MHALVGKCGTLDVEDVKASVDYLVKEGKGEHGPGKQLVTGGSHGGFLTAHRKFPIHSTKDRALIFVQLLGSIQTRSARRCCVTLSSSRNHQAQTYPIGSYPSLACVHL